MHERVTDIDKECESNNDKQNIVQHLELLFWGYQVFRMEGVVRANLSLK